MNEPIETQQPLPEVHTVQLRLGEPVSALDGPFGELADIVIDPHSRVVTHVVIEPRHHHYQARLVPIGLVSADGDRIQVDLDSDRLRLLERVVDIDYLRMTDPITVDGNWDIGTEDVLAMPYSWGSTAMTSYDDSAAMIQWDRVPKGECEVRRSSAVLVDGGQCIGHVAGFVADGDHLTGVVVERGHPGLAHHTLVPMGSVARVSNDHVALDMDAATFKALPKAAGLEGPLGDHSRTLRQHLDGLLHHRRVDD